MDAQLGQLSVLAISIHALREEGDSPRLASIQICRIFQSTPSARRATAHSLRCRKDSEDFNPRPPRGGRLCLDAVHHGRGAISIHALREEGDSTIHSYLNSTFLFQSTPSARRATAQLRTGHVLHGISIHALREEGDVPAAARVNRPADFNPRPPRGGRLDYFGINEDILQFQSTPSARRATNCGPGYRNPRQISIHALREEGDVGFAAGAAWGSNFNPRPPRGGRRVPPASSSACGTISIHALREEGDTQ